MTARESRTGGQGGFAMLEVLVSLLLAAFAVVAMAGLQGRASAVELEANQRSQALVLVQDMAERIAANRLRAADYVIDDLGLGPVAECAGAATLAERDACEWGNRLRGASTSRAGRDVGAMIGARGCVAFVGDARYVVTVAWQGAMPGAAPSAPCGRGQYGDESLRRAVSTLVRIADLQAL
jgi:type IV pilus assembly protein PilV